MSLYELFLTLHVISAVTWLGAGFAITMLLLSARRAKSPEREGQLHAEMDFLAPALFIPSSLATLLFGVLSAIEGNWDFGQTWITIGLVGWAASFLTGFFYFRTESEKIAAIVEAKGPSAQEATRRSRRMTAVDHIELTILYLVLVTMVVKPTGDDTGVLVALGAIFIAAVALNVPALRGSRAA